jgi:hypothetical protein
MTPSDSTNCMRCSSVNSIVRVARLTYLLGREEETRNAVLIDPFRVGDVIN